jgi:hypothetical protein
MDLELHTLHYKRKYWEVVPFEPKQQDIGFEKCDTTIFCIAKTLLGIKNAILGSKSQKRYWSKGYKPIQAFGTKPEITKVLEEQVQEVFVKQF